MPKKEKTELPEEISKKLKVIGEKLTNERQAVEPNYKKFSEKHEINNMTLWRMQNGHDFKMSKLIQILDILGISLEEFFKDMD